MRVIRVISAALLGLGALTFCAPAAVAHGGDDYSHGGDSRSYGGEGGYGKGGGPGRHGGGDEGRFGGRGGHGPEHFRHGIRAGEGGTGSGFNLKEVGTGAALVAGSVGTAYYLSRRRTDEGGGTA